MSLHIDGQGCQLFWYLCSRFNESKVTKINKRMTAYEKPHAIVEDDRGRRYRVLGNIGEPGDQFEMDVSLGAEVMP